LIDQSKRLLTAFVLVLPLGKLERALILALVERIPGLTSMQVDSGG
jgi:hypothetical protein